MCSGLASAAQFRGLTLQATGPTVPGWRAAAGRGFQTQTSIQRRINPTEQLILSGREGHQKRTGSTLPSADRAHGVLGGGREM